MGSFEEITAGISDVEITGRQIIANHEIPFGAELLTDTPDELIPLGALACVASKGTQVDDEVVAKMATANNS